MTQREIKGDVTRIFYQGDRDFVIAQVTDTQGERITIKGNIPGISRGSTVQITGTVEVHEKFGEQLNVTACSETQPTDALGMARFFERVDGVGKKYAQILAQHMITLGDDPTHIEIASCPDVPHSAAQAAADEWCNNRARNTQLARLQGLGLTPLQADRAIDQWSTSAVAKVEANPYILCELLRIGFKVADEIAKASFEIDHADPRRIKQGIIYTLKESCTTGGHTGLPRDTLVSESARVLGVHDRQVEKPLAWLLDDERLIQQHDLIFDPITAMDEDDVARRAVSIAGESPYQFELDACETNGLTDEQSEAVRYAMEEGGFLILTGGPGTGKTHTTRSIIQAWKKRNNAIEVDCDSCGEQGCLRCDKSGYTVKGVGRPVYLAAPTGRAAKRMEEMSGQPAQTIHRLLKCRPSGDGFTWRRQLREIDGLVIIDEVSMLDTHMAATLLERISDASTVVFVGDPDQLPSIGPGYLLHDLIESGACKSVKLTKIHRQKEGSGIIRCAYAVQSGDTPDLRQMDDFKTIRVQSAEGAEKAVKACYERLGEKGFTLPDGSPVNIFQDVQCLSPMKKKGRAGTSESINDIVQASFFGNEPHVKVFGTRFFAGDRVMQTANDYEKGVYNGDVGSVVEVTPGATGEDVAALIEFEGSSVEYTRSDLATSVSRAYCVTIHKSQGSEYPVVILVITGAHHYMLERTLLYTGITRASKMAILIYDTKGLKRAIQNNPPNARYRALNQRIQMEINQ